MARLGVCSISKRVLSFMVQSTEEVFLCDFMESNCPCRKLTLFFGRGATVNDLVNTFRGIFSGSQLQDSPGTGFKEHTDLE